jgi:hypothetical protein
MIDLFYLTMASEPCLIRSIRDSLKVNPCPDIWGVINTEFNPLINFSSTNFTSKTMRQDLLDIQEHMAKQGSLKDLVVYLEVEPAQKDKTNGIEVRLGIINNGNQEIYLLNPFNILQFQVMKQMGYPLKIPTKPPNLLINDRGGDGGRIEPALKIVRVLRNNQAVEIRNINEEVLKIAAHEEYQVYFEIDRLLEEQSRSTPSGGASEYVEVSIPDGVYRIRCIATLINSSNTQESRILQSQGVQVDFLKRK